MKLLLAVAFAVTVLQPMPAQADAPIGIENNNPGNIKPKTPGVYKGGFPGAIGIDKYNYLRFRRPIDGIRAIVINLKIYRRRHGIRTSFNIASRWTYQEASPHVVHEYSHFMATRLGVGCETKLNFGDPCVLYRLTRAIVHFENGFDPYPAKLYSKIFPTCGLM